MTTRMHMSLDVRGALRWPQRRLANMFRRADGSYASAYEAVEFLFDQLAAGHKVLPLGECEGFSFETGCPGHDEVTP